MTLEPSLVPWSEGILPSDGAKRRSFTQPPTRVESSCSFGQRPVLTPDDGHDHNAAWLLAAFENPSPTHLAAWVEALRKRLAAPELKALQETILRWADWVVRQRIGLDMGVSDMAQVNALQGDGELSDYVEARRRAWMEEYREERREQGHQEGLQEGLQLSRHLLTRQATRRFGPQIGQRLAKEVANVDDVARFEQIGVLILDSSDGDELLRGLNAKPH